MLKINISAKKLHEIEKKLNQIHFKDFEIGSTLSFYFDRLYRGDFDNRFFRNFFNFGYYFIKSISTKKYKKDYQKSLFYFKSGLQRHHQAMEEAVLHNEDLEQKTLVIGPEHDCELSKGKVFYNSNLITLFKIIIFLSINIYKITAYFKPLNLNIKTRATLYIYLIIQLLKVNSLKMFIIEQPAIKLIGADFDRGVDSSLLFTVAKALGIKSFTLQHGVINPPVGYSPINASEIWVWGEMARLQLMELGVDENKIRKTGTSIVKEYEISNEIRQNTLETYKLYTGRTFVLALSSPNKLNDIKLIKLFVKAKKIFGEPSDNFLVKIHPARNISDYSWIEDQYNLHVLPQKIPHEDFLNIVDVLLAHTSGIATEALYHGKKVGILDVLDISPGNGLELNKYFNIPLLKSVTELINFLEIEKCALINDLVYYKTGEAAKVEITKNIQNLID